MRISDWSSDVCSSDLRNAPDVGFVEPLSNAVGHDLAVEVITPLRDFGLQLLGGLSGLLAGNGRLPGFDDLLKVLGVSDELLVALLVLVEVVAVPFELVWFHLVAEREPVDVFVRSKLLQDDLNGPLDHQGRTATDDLTFRSEERRVGKECVRMGRYRWPT